MGGGGGGDSAAVGGSGVDLGRVAFSRTSTCWLVIALTAFNQQTKTAFIGMKQWPVQGVKYRSWMRDRAEMDVLMLHQEQSAHQTALHTTATRECECEKNNKGSGNCRID
jgi:hypothetical protein